MRRTFKLLQHWKLCERIQHSINLYDIKMALLLQNNVMWFFSSLGFLQGRPEPMKGMCNAYGFPFSDTQLIV